jgi:hypothetical protein
MVGKFRASGKFYLGGVRESEGAGRMVGHTILQLLRGLTTL